MIKNKIFKLLSILMSYPTNSLKESLDYMLLLIKNDELITEHSKEKLKTFIQYIKNNELHHLQENYVLIFDRQKKFSLYLFEHIYGDSRERGSAIIDLQNLYKNNKFEINEFKESADYIPLFLEFISLIEKKNADVILSEIINIISIIKKRLEIIKSQYYIIFFILEELSDKKPDTEIIKKIINKDKLSNFENNVDEEWEEKKIF